MYIIRGIIVSLLFLNLNVISFAEEKIIFEQQIPNGCGPANLPKFIPNSTPISKCEFKNACDNHDVCYAKCLPGGELHGNRVCKNLALRKERRQLCEVKFFEDLVSNNNGRYICRAYANIYSAATQYLGLTFFNGANPKDNKISRTQFEAELQSIYSSIPNSDIERDVNIDFKLEAGRLSGSIDLGDSN